VQESGIDASPGFVPVANYEKGWRTGFLRLHAVGILITGASQGLGKEIARACLAEGASVMLCARDAGTLEKTATELSGIANHPGRVHAMAADVRDPAAVGKLVDEAAARLPNFLGVVNNAGMWGPKGRIEEISWEEWQYAAEVNLFGVVHVCRKTVPLLRRRGYGKIVNLSGGGATAPMPYLSCYAATKAAVVRFTETLAGEVRDAGIDVNAMAPGALNTSMLAELLAAGPENIGRDHYARALKQKETGGGSLAVAAELCVRLLSPETDGITGRLISAVWDPWKKFSEFRKDLLASDVYTLRRITPADRGFDWDKEFR
jgi:NAD(P)-dependent dehydrogenase (short-subunit alcohol dehydrogenase family)